MSKKEENQEIILNPIQIKKIKITIKGKSPLIVNNFNEKSRQQIINKTIYEKDIHLGRYSVDALCLR